MKLSALLFFLSISINANSQVETFSVYFSSNSDKLTEDQRKNITFLTNSDFNIINLEGHCDTNGTIQYNEQLALRRIEHVQSILGAESPKTTIVGEKDAAKANSYAAQAFRKVDILYEPRINSSKFKAEIKLDTVVVSPTLVNSFEIFISDTTSTETTIQLSLLFVNNTAKLLPESESELSKLFDLMYDNPSIKAHIRGHVCCVEYCTWDEISDNRAYFVYKFLKDNSINPNRLSFKGYGTSIPFVSPEITEADRRLNRRVDIIFTKQK